MHMVSSIAIVPSVFFVSAGHPGLKHAPHFLHWSVTGLHLYGNTFPLGAAKYPEHIVKGLEQEHTVYKIDAMAEAKNLGNSKVFNIIVLGMAAKHMDFSKEAWLKIIEKTSAPCRELRTVLRHIRRLR